jgi:hypothetical protein
MFVGMINKKRVRFFRYLIYAAIVLLLFLPLVLMSVLSFHMMNLAQNMNNSLDEMKTIASEPPPEPESDPDPVYPEGTYLIEPEEEAFNPSAGDEAPPPQTADISGDYISDSTNPGDSVFSAPDYVEPHPERGGDGFVDLAVSGSNPLDGDGAPVSGSGPLDGGGVSDYASNPLDSTGAAEGPASVPQVPEIGEIPMTGR